MEPINTEVDPVRPSSQSPRRHRLPAVALAAFITFMVGIVLIANSGHGPRVFAFVAWIPHYDKVGHFLLMGILSLLAVAAVAPRLRWRPLVSSSVVVSVVAAIVTLEELSQSKFASRTYSGIDLLFSLAGIVSLGLLGHYIAFQAKRQRNH